MILGVLIEEPTILDPEVNIPLRNQKCYEKKEMYLHACSHDGNGDGKSDTKVGPETWFNALENLRPKF